MTVTRKQAKARARRKAYERVRNMRKNKVPERVIIFGNKRAYRLHGT